MKSLCVIPARGGSKRIPRKNIRNFCGRPTIAWPIETAKKAACFDRILVSTDDEEIAEIASDWGAEIPFIRPSALANDSTPTRDVINHAIDFVTENGDKPEYVCCLYATAVFVRAEDVVRGLDSLRMSDSDFAFSVTSYPYPIQRALRLSQLGTVEMFYPEHESTRSQDLQEAYHDAGQFYWGRVHAYLGNRPIFESISTPIIIPRHRAQDIDTPEDWEYAELMFSITRQNDRPSE